MFTVLTRLARPARRLAQALVGALGIVAIVGSGGGIGAIGFPDGPCANSDCNVTFAFATIAPTQQTIQVGGTVTFTAAVTGNVDVTLQWRRSSDGINFVDIAGATASTYTLTGAQRPDDRTVFQIQARHAGTVVATATASLAVSSMPPLEIADSEFDASGWTATAAAFPEPGPTFEATQGSIGGPIGNYRLTTLTMPVGPSSLSVFSVSTRAAYDPRTQGALYLIDYGEDCLGTGTTTIGSAVTAGLLLRQGGRLFAMKSTFNCNRSATVTVVRKGLDVTAFAIVQGPPCGSGESCPDFSSGGAPIEFGYLRSITLPLAAAAGVAAYGIDNWKLTLWRQ